MKKLLALILALMLATTVFTACSTESSDDKDEDEISEDYQDAIEKFEKVLNGKVTEKSIKALMPDEVWDCLDLDGDDLEEIEDTATYVKEDIADYMNEDILWYDGIEPEDITIVYDVEDDPEKLSKKERSRLEGELEDCYGEKFEIENAYELYGAIRFEIDFSNVEDEDDVEEIEYELEDMADEINAYAVLIDGEWYLLDSEATYVFIFFPYCEYYYEDFVIIEDEPAMDDAEEVADEEAPADEAEDATEAEWVFQSAIDNYEELFNGNVTKSTLKAVMPDVAWNYLGLTSSDIRDIEDFAYSYCYEDIFDLHEDISQEDIVWMLDVESTDSLTYSEIWDIEEELEDYYGEYIAVDEAYELHCVLRFDVDLDCIYYYDEREEVEDDLYYFDNEDVYAYAIKIDGKWYLVDGYDRYMFRFPACGWFFDDYTTEDEEAAAEDDWYYEEDETVGTKLAEVFRDSATTYYSCEDIAYTLIEDLPFAAGVVPVEEGYLSGFDNHSVEGFSEAYMFAPMIGSIPFVGYVFDLSYDVDVDDFMDELEYNANLRWNICVEADELVVDNVGDKVFFVMCPSSFDVDESDAYDDFYDEEVAAE